MQNKLQEITDKLYNEGLSKGRQEAEELLKKAREESEKLVADAKKEAARILSDAEKEAVELKTKAENDIKMASAQSFASIKQQIENSIITKAISEPVSATANDTGFIREIMLAIVTAFNPASSDPVALEMLLPENKKETLDKFIKEKIEKLMHLSKDKVIFYPLCLDCFSKVVYIPDKRVKADLVAVV